MVNRISEPSKLTLSEIHNSMEISAIICYWSTFMKKTLKSNRNYLRFLEQQKKNEYEKEKCNILHYWKTQLKKKTDKEEADVASWMLNPFFFWQRNNSH